MRSAAYLIAATLLLGLELGRANWLSVALAVPLVIAAFSGLGLLAAGTTMLVRRLNPSFIGGSWPERKPLETDDSPERRAPIPHQ